MIETFINGGLLFLAIVLAPAVMLATFLLTVKALSVIIIGINKVTGKHGE